MVKLPENTGMHVINEQPSTKQNSQGESSSSSPATFHSLGPLLYFFSFPTPQTENYSCVMSFQKKKIDINHHVPTIIMSVFFPLVFSFLFFFFSHRDRKFVLNPQSWKKKNPLEVSYYKKPQLPLLVPWGRDSNSICLS